MNETEKDRILRMVSEGTIKPGEAASLLASLSEEAEAKPDEKKRAEEEEKKNLSEVKIRRPDGTHYSIQVPPDLLPMIWQFTKVAIKESARTASQEAWSGLKTIVKTKTHEVKTSVQTRMAGSKSEPAPAAPTEETNQLEARRRILQMVQNGRITADDASRLIQELDALDAYQKTHPTPVAALTK